MSRVTRDGFHYKTNASVHEGNLRCTGVVAPPSNTSKTTIDVSDAIVIGAGYAGLTACRDLCNSGLKALLLEARDRIGGRTWTAEVDGHLYEMGGTWIHWNQPHTYREVSHYNFGDLQNNNDARVGCNYFTLISNGGRREISYREPVVMTNNAFTLFCDVDGQGGRSILPLPHDAHSNPDIQKWEKMSASQRLKVVWLTIQE